MKQIPRFNSVHRGLRSLGVFNAFTSSGFGIQHVSVEANIQSGDMESRGAHHRVRAITHFAFVFIYAEKPTCYTSYVFDPPHHSPSMRGIPCPSTFLVLHVRQEFI